MEVPFRSLRKASDHRRPLKAKIQFLLLQILSLRDFLEEAPIIEVILQRDILANPTIG